MLKKFRQVNIYKDCHSRNPESFRESGIFLKTKKDSGQAGMTNDKKDSFV
jgi:hypothetical protein